MIFIPDYDLVSTDDKNHRRKVRGDDNQRYLFK